MSSMGGGSRTEAPSPQPPQWRFEGHPRLDPSSTHKVTIPTGQMRTSPTGTADTVDEVEEGWHNREMSSSHGNEPRPDVATLTSPPATTRAAAPPFLPHRLLRRDMAPPQQPFLKPPPPKTSNSSAAAAGISSSSPDTTILGRRDSGNSLLSWARSRQQRFATKAAESTKKSPSDHDSSDSDDDDGSYRGYRSDDYQDDFQPDDDDEASDDASIDSLETEDGGVIAIGLPAPTILASGNRHRHALPPTTPAVVPPPPRTPEEASQRAVSQAVAESVAEEEHLRKSGEKLQLAGAVAAGAVIVRRTRNSSITDAAATAPDSKQRAVRDNHADQEIKNAIRRQMGGGVVAPSLSEAGAVRSTTGGGTGGAASAAAASYAAQRSLQEQSKLRGFPEEEKEEESGPSLAPATLLLLPAVATPHRNPAELNAAAYQHHFAARSHQERVKQEEAGPSLAPATTTAVPGATIHHLPPVRSAPGAYAATSTAGQESLKQDDGPTLAPAAAIAEPAQQTSLSRAASDESAATTASGSWVAQTGIPVLPGAFAVEGIEAAQRRRDSRDSYDPEDPEVGTTDASGALYDPAHTIDDLLDDGPLGLAASLRHNESPTVPTGLGDASILHVSSYVVGSAPTMIDAIDPFEAELQVVVEGAVIVADDSGAVDAKTIRRLRVVQGSILCLAIASVGLIIGALLGFRAAPAEEPLGWVQVGADIHGPREEPQVFFGQTLVATEDGTRIVAAAPGMDKTLLLNVGQIAVFEATTNGNNGPDWQESSTITGNVASPVAECSLALARDGRRIVSGYPHLGRGVVHVHDAAGKKTAPTTWDLIDTISAPEPSSGDDGEVEADWFGYSVDVSGDGNVVVVGSPMKVAEGKINAGAVLLYRWVDTQWELWGNSVAGDNENDLLGWSLAIRPTGKGYRVVAGGPSHNAEAGLVQIWDFANGEWGIATTLTGTKPLNRFGEAVVLSQDGNTLVVGARGNAFDKGQVFVYNYVDEQWIQETHVFEGVDPAEGYGAALALSPHGTVLAIGAPQNAEFGLDSGKVEIFKRDPTGAWIREGRSIHGNSGEELGRSVALSLEGKRLVAGGPSATFDGSIAQAGVVRVYDRDE